MNRIVVLLSSCLAVLLSSCHVLVVSPVTCGISITYRTSREPPTQYKDIFQLSNALLSVELNVRHYASNFILFQLK